MLSSKCQIERDNQFFRPGIYTPANTAQHVAGLLCCKGMLVTPIQLFVHHNVQAIFSKAAFSLKGPELYHCRSYAIPNAGLLIILCAMC